TPVGRDGGPDGVGPLQRAAGSRHAQGDPGDPAGGRGPRRRRVRRLACAGPCPRRVSRRLGRHRPLEGPARLKVAATWVPWTSALLARRSGYGAGVDAPGWYRHLATAPDAAPTRF